MQTGWLVRCWCGCDVFGYQVHEVTIIAIYLVQVTALRVYIHTGGLSTAVSFTASSSSYPWMATQCWHWWHHEPRSLQRHGLIMCGLVFGVECLVGCSVLGLVTQSSSLLAQSLTAVFRNRTSHLPMSATTTARNVCISCLVQRNICMR